MKNAYLTCLIVLSAQVETPAPRPPNIVFFLVDDLGWADITPNNPESFYETPNIQALADSGMRFSAAYAACPVCSPTRASIMSGRYPARIHTTDYFGAAQPGGILKAGAKGKRGRFQRLPFLPAEYVNHLPLEEVTLAEALKDNGYATYFAGKWHLGGDGFLPTDQGFDVNIGGQHRGGPYGGGSYLHPFPKWMPNLESEEGDVLPLKLAEETVKFITAHKDEPFLAYLSFYSVHTPLVGEPGRVEHFKDKAEGMETEWGEEGTRKVRQTQAHPTYAAMVGAMDDAVGQVLAAIDDLGLRDNTIVVFFSDNGGLSTSEGSPTSNLPLRAGKGWLYDGGVREPCLVRWPGVTPSGSVCDEPIISMDFYPTLLEAAGLGALPEQHLDGRSFTSLLRGEEMERGPIFWHYPHWGNQGGWPGSAMRVGDWKLVARHGEYPAELYNLAADPGELHDLAGEEPERTAKLLAKLVSWREDLGARMPAPNPYFDPDDAAPH